MRVNIYNEELTGDIRVVETTADTGKTFYGVRCFLKSAPELHHMDDDDDRSAVTFWVGTREDAIILSDSIYRSLPHRVRLGSESFGG